MEDSKERYPKICLDSFLKKNTSDLLAFCNCIYEHSFAVFEISSDLVEKLKCVNDENIKFFTSLNFETKMQTQVLFNEVGENKGLTGFNIPSSAKELFRIRRPLIPSQFVPYTDAFRTSNEWCRNFLESLALECTRELLLDYNRNINDLQNENDNDRIKENIDVEQVINYHCELNYQLPEGKFYPSPYDLFYYPNDAKVTIPNCSDHIDPGFITLDPCAFVAGLEIFDTKTGKWLEIEKELEPLKHIVVFPGKYLQTMTNNYFFGSAHRVTKNTQPRFSFVYEWRPRAI